MEFRNDYNFLSNIYPCHIQLNINGTHYSFNSAETAFQAMKDKSRRDEFRKLNGFAARRLGRTVKLPPDWDNKKLNIMKTILHAKFVQNPWLLAKLRTIMQDIVEENTWNDTYWGVCNGVGENHLGKLLMELRDDTSIQVDLKSSETLCFTGRRPKDLCGYDKKEDYQSLLNKTIEICEQFYQKGYRRFISGGAQGFDQIAFWAVHSLKRRYPDIQNILYIPFYGQEYRWSGYGLFSRNDYAKILTYADKVKYITYDIDIDEHRDVMVSLSTRNEAMVDSSSVVLGLYPDDTWQTAKGGTASCMRYANEKQQKGLCELYQLSYNITDNTFTDFVLKQII